MGTVMDYAGREYQIRDVVRPRFLDRIELAVDCDGRPVERLVYSDGSVVELPIGEHGPIVPCGALSGSRP